MKLKVSAKGVAQRKLQLVRTPKNNLPRHPMPFAAKNMYYDERWIEKQEEGTLQITCHKFVVENVNNLQIHVNKVKWQSRIKNKSGPYGGHSLTNLRSYPLYISSHSKQQQTKNKQTNINNNNKKETRDICYSSSPWMGCQSILGLSPGLSSMYGPHLYAWVKRDNMEQSFLSRETTQKIQKSAKLETS